ncbi:MULTISPECIES: hypothetical protein [unclassified Nodularia (in: cyanobacteria)]|uniref:hypothetical protein n=2 Tax=Nodularia TaxID=159191 RepID=UPI001D119F5D|nr:hypothetical protein [Nodularia sp. LEGE 04288]
MGLIEMSGGVVLAESPNSWTDIFGVQGKIGVAETKYKFRRRDVTWKVSIGVWTSIIKNLVHTSNQQLRKSILLLQSGIHTRYQTTQMICAIAEILCDNYF